MVILSVFRYLEDIFLEALEDMIYMNKNNIHTPIVPCIFNVDEYIEDHDSSTSYLIHKFMATLLFISI